MTNKNYCDCRQGRDQCTCKAVEPTIDRHKQLLAQVDKAQAEMAGWPDSWPDKPVPPAGGGVEVLVWLHPDGTTELASEFPEHVTPCHAKALIDRAHVTRLQAEVESLKKVAKAYIASDGERSLSEHALRAELTKAREVIQQAHDRIYANETLTAYMDLRDYLSNQSAPADKAPPLIQALHANGDLIAMEATIAQQAQRIADLEADKGQGKREGKRERFQKWVLATKHPVLGFLDGHWLARGDDREGYANEYVQGLWVAYKAFATEQPEPVAVVLPDRMPVPVYQIAPLAAESAIGWNNCLKEVARLNPARPEKSAPVQVLAEARDWLGDGKHADGLAREHWTPEYAALIDRIDATLSK